MIFAISAFSIKVRKKLDFGCIFGGQSEENSMKNRLYTCVVFQRPILKVFSSISTRFWSPKIAIKSQIFEKIEVWRRPLKHYRIRAAF